MKLGQIIEEGAFDREQEFRHGFPMFRGQARKNSQGGRRRTSKDVILEAK